MYQATQQFTMWNGYKNGKTACVSGGGGGGGSGSALGGSQGPSPGASSPGCCLKGDLFTYYNTASHACCNNDIVPYGTC